MDAEKTGREVLVISDKDKSKALLLEKSDGDISFSCELHGEPLLNFKYSHLTPFSASLPWNLRHEEPDRLKITGLNGHSVRVEAFYEAFKSTDVISFRGGYMWLKRRWEICGGGNLPHAVLGTCIPSGGSKQKVTIPHVVYNGNPSASEKIFVPRLRETGGYSLVVEEHRLPVPAVNVEWGDKKGYVSLTVLSLPSKVELPGMPDEHWWSSGVVRSEKRWNIVSLSGAVAINNIKDAVYDYRRSPVPLPGGGYLDLFPGNVLEKTLVIDLSRCREGRGFRRIVKMGWDILHPRTEKALTLQETINLKKNALVSRWREGQVSGFLLIPRTRKEGNVYNRPLSFLFGWTGQSLRLAWCSIRLGIEGKNGRLLDMGYRVMDSFTEAPPPGPAAGLKCLRYDIEKNVWQPWGPDNRLTPSRAFGEALSNMCDCILLLRKYSLPVKTSWLKTIGESAFFLARKESLNHKRIFPLLFTEGGAPSDKFIAAGGVSCVTALLSAYEVTGEKAFLEKGLALLKRYYSLFADTLETPFSHATLDARCEDKEAGLLFFSAAYRAFLLTGSTVYGEYARVAADWVSTFVYLWEPGFRKGSICDRQGFRAVFWPGVSVQNMHLDVFFYPFEVYRLGRILNDKTLIRLGQGIMKAWTHGISRYTGDWGYPVAGEQAEQFFQTNFSFGSNRPAERWRGGFNPWNTSWIIAMVLQSALLFAGEKKN